MQNLARENVTAHVYQTGNTVIDAFATTMREGYRFKSGQLRGIDLSAGRTILLTAHRRENLGKHLRQIFRAVLEIANRFPDIQIIYPVHKNPAVMEPARELLGAHPRIHLIDPVDVEDLHNLLGRIDLVLTDSGGLQEEAPALGKPVLVLRTETERPEAVEAGVVRVAGVDTADIIKAAHLLLTDNAAYLQMSRALNPYGDGHASERICNAILEFFNAR